MEIFNPIIPKEKFLKKINEKKLTLCFFFKKKFLKIYNYN